MNKFLKNYNHYGQGTLWVKETKLRQSKIRQSQERVRPEEAVPHLYSRATKQPQVIFAR